MAAEPAVGAGPAAFFSFAVLNDFPENKTFSAQSDYVVAAGNNTCCFNVITHNANLCSSLSFSFSGEIIPTRFFSQSAVACRWKLLADAAELSKLNFTIAAGAITPVCCAGNGALVRSRSERRVFLNQTVYLNCGVLRL